LRAVTYTPDGKPIAMELPSIGWEGDKDHNPEGRAKVKGILKTWLKNKVLDIEEREDSTRQKRKFIIQAHGARGPSSPMLTVV
jgi:hypothetical protein